MVDPVVADRIRKVVAFTFAVVETFLLFRVLARLARGSLHLDDVELWIVVALGTLALWWVAHAKHVRRTAPDSTAQEMEEDA